MQSMDQKLFVKHMLMDRKVDHRPDGASTSFLAIIFHQNLIEFAFSLQAFLRKQLFVLFWAGKVHILK